MCLLSLIEDEPSYGYEMASKLSDQGLDLVSEGSIYPTLSRMQRSGLIEGYFVEADGPGPPRKYYRIAKDGKQRLKVWKKEWDTLSTGVNQVVKGDTGDRSDQ